VTIRALVVDDEPLARQLVCRLLAGEADVAVVGECGSGAEALPAIERLDPDVLFLDVQMPGLSGFDVVARLAPPRVPYVVFVTAYDRYAIRAFEIQALDYLLKPFTKERFAESVRRAKAALRHRRLARFEGRLAALAAEYARLHATLDASPGVPPTFVTEFRVRDGQVLRAVPASDVAWIEAENQYARLHVRGDSHLLAKSIGALERELDPQLFCRIHRSAIVNTAFVREVRAEKNGACAVVLSRGKVLRLSRRRRGHLAALLRRGAGG
jgi:two-component system LytT family response regulator